MSVIWFYTISLRIYACIFNTNLSTFSKSAAPSPPNQFITMISFLHYYHHHHPNKIWCQKPWHFISIPLLLSSLQLSIQFNLLKKKEEKVIPSQSRHPISHPIYRHPHRKRITSLSFTHHHHHGYLSTDTSSLSSSVLADSSSHHHPQSFSPREEEQIGQKLTHTLRDKCFSKKEKLSPGFVFNLVFPHQPTNLDPPNYSPS